MPLLKPPSVPPSLEEPPRGPVPQAYYNPVARDGLAAIAAAKGKQLSHLSKMTVDSDAGALWGAILDYIAYSPVPAGHPAVDLHVPGCRRTRDDNEDARSTSSYDGSDDSASDAEDTPSRASYARPVFQLGTSSVEFLWPPPSNLTAEALIARRADLDADANLVELIRDEATPRGPGAGAAGAPTGAPNTIHLLYYLVGDPVPTNCGVETKHEMMLVSDRGHATLMRFATEIIEWSQKQHSVVDQYSRFPVQRFRMQGDSGHWEFEGLKRARPAESVVLAGDQMQKILHDAESFMRKSTYSWYFRHGLPYRRSFLFFGPPGTGKTSTVRVLASKFSLQCCMLSVANQNFSNQALGDALSSIPGKALLVLEDVDALFNKDRSSRTDNQLTFSGMLNALDGIVSVEGLITVMTTNHIERLERALIRGGRVDRRFRFDLPSEAQLVKLFRSFYPDCADGVATSFAAAVLARPEGNEARAVSTLQQLFIEMREKSAEECVAGIDDFFTLYFPPEDLENGA